MNKNDAESAEFGDSNTVVLHSDFLIKGAQFQIVFLRDEQGNIVSGKWINTDIIFELNDIANYFGFTLPDFLDFELYIKSIGLMYSQASSGLNFNAEINNFGTLKLQTLKLPDQQSRQYDMSLQFDKLLAFSNLPIIGEYCDDGDGFKFNKIGLNYKPELEVILSLFSDFVIKKNRVELNLDYVKSLDPKPNQVLAMPQLDNSIHWLEINKSFSVLYFSKVGISLAESNITLYLDASFTVSVLRMDFYELYVSTSLKNLKDFSFGLGGLMVTLQNPTFSLSGGLYRSQEEELLYNGALGFKFNQYSFQALASYGEMPGSKEKTFFAYLMVGAPIGGPPFFFINGLALGLGVNRSLKLPDLSRVRSFPLVAAAMGDDSELKPDSSPRQALSTLSKSIVPESGQYFMSAGVKFLTYGVLESFALINVEMGKRIVISLLGISNASIPLKVTGANNPIVRAELAMRASFDSEQGEILIMAALTDRSYLLHPSCKLTGGFAIGYWLKGEYSGDFVITLGGCHHPRFNNIHYPTIPALGISWIISKHISVKGGAYFAITPSCMMAGVNFSLLFEMGALKAWFNAAADFILNWKPYFYEARVHVSVGASYRISIFGIGKTFKIEMGANLNIWGPEFSGKVKINWYIISFTIHFGAGSSQQPKPIEWSEFVNSFIPGAADKSVANQTLESSSSKQELKLTSINVTNGVLAQYKDDSGNEIDVVDGFRISMIIDHQTPCTQVYYNNEPQLSTKSRFGIVPMGLADVQMDLHITLKNIDNNELITCSILTNPSNAPLCLSPIVRNTPSALWGREGINLNAPLLKNMIFGISLISNQSISNVHIIPAKGKYDEKVLTANESITLALPYNDPIFVEPKTYPIEQKTVINMFQRTISNNTRQKNIVSQLSKQFDTRNSTTVNKIAEQAKSVLFSAPILRTICSR